MCEIDKGTLGQPFLCIACLLLVVNNIYLQIFHSKSYYTTFFHFLYNAFIDDYLQPLNVEIPLLGEEQNLVEKYELHHDLQCRVQTSTKDNCVLIYKDIRQAIM